MIKITKYITSLLTLLICLVVFSGTSYANCDSRPLSGNHIITTDCSFTGITDANDGARLVDGVDSGTDTNTAILTVQSGILLINSNQTIALGSLSLTGGSVAISSGAVIQIGMPIWFIDQDDDGYPADLEAYVQTSAPTNGKRRNTLTSVTSLDCDDADGGTSGETTYYQDLDGDTYGNSGVTNSACSPPGGYVTNSTDCYDANPSTTNAELAYPGSATCLGSNRGDGSYDYNCNSSETYCGTVNNYGCGNCGNISSGRCIGAMYDKRCGSTSFANYCNGINNGCGVYGCICTGTSAQKTNCTSDGDRCWFDSSGSYCSSVSASNQTCQ